MTTSASIAADLAGEHAALDEVVADLRPAQWELATASPGWSVADQIGHLAFFDRRAVEAITEPDVYEQHKAAFYEALAADRSQMDPLTLSETRAMDPAQLLAHWRHGREQLLVAAAGLDDGDRVVWYGPSMGAKSFLTARLMETWAHGQDVVDAVGAHRPPTHRLRHIAQLGVITRGWSYANRGLEPDDTPVWVDLTAPDGSSWQWGDADATQSITGPAEDFCLVVTQRRHVDDTRLEVVGSSARRWMELAQAFAGGATDGPSAGRFG